MSEILQTIQKAIYADRAQFVVTNDEGLQKSLIGCCGLVGKPPKASTGMAKGKNDTSCLEG
jgi:hypothetical protein